MNLKNLFIASLVAITISAVIHALNAYEIISLDFYSLISLRVVTVLILVYYSIKKHSLTAWIFVSMIIGIEVGYDLKEFAISLKILSDIFLRLIKTIIAPLLFSTLVVGIASHSNLKQVGRMGWKSIVFFEIITTIALFIGLVAINISNAGVGTTVVAQQNQVEKAHTILEQKQSHNFILDIFPENIAKSIADNQVLQVVVFSILFGIALAMLKDKKKKPVLEFFESMSEVMFKFTDIVMWFAPFAVGGAIAFAVASMGLDILKNLMLLVVTVYISMIVLIIVVLVPVGIIVKLPFRKFINAVTEPVSIAFATASSEAALPKAMENMIEMNIPKKVVAFVLPTGYSFNLIGTTLYLSLVSVFVAQSCGLNLSISQQIQMCLILMLTSKGVAGVRGSAFLILVSTVSALGLDPQKAFAVLAIDALLDMARSAVNVLGNCLATFVVAKWEKEI
ncbi:MAG: dicarboxylate/amino acid:cation symporter [Bacteroidia bacterium]